MNGWLQAALKAVLPHVGDIVSATKPAFTNRKADLATNPPELVQQQIAELQAAVSQQSAHVKELAAQLESTVLALEKAACRPEDAVMIGDQEETDILGAKRMGITSIIVKTGVYSRDETKTKADAVVETVDDVAESI